MLICCQDILGRKGLINELCRDALLPIETIITSYPVEPTTEVELQDCLSWRINSILGNLEIARTQAQDNIEKVQNKQR
ncbi:9300_t:CDS:2 [Dentiscutata erythropus]|uniref:9300_t:CDS:1 n=1 Tax=Dentiscutata erythropus TaxID=1348616 RepID=A0A9N9C4Q4_9GLOM|nr:9300_t:CDS:2 [Dentiscutata erythropus]